MLFLHGPLQLFREHGRVQSLIEVIHDATCANVFIPHFIPVYRYFCVLVYFVPYILFTCVFMTMLKVVNVMRLCLCMFRQPAKFKYLHKHAHTRLIGGWAFPLPYYLKQSMPDSMTLAQPLTTFRQFLNTFLFSISFPDIILDNA